jgi:GPH family glycoside/pentoside/hexuronide:cation symporter
MERGMNSSDKLPVRQKLLFSTGDLSTSLPLAILMFFQLVFLTDVAGLRPDLAGWAVGLGKIWDAINDPLFGLISDRLRTRWGRRRGVLLFGAAPLGLSFMLMWIVPPLNQLGLTVYYTLTFILFDSVFTFIHVSYNSLTPELTQDYDERSSLNGYRMIFNISGTLGAIIVATILGWVITDKRLLFSILGVGLGLATIVPPFIVFKVTHEKPADEQPKPLPMSEAILATLSNRPFWMVMGLYLLSWTTASVLAAVLIYFVQYYLLVPDQANYFVLTFEFSAILFIPLWVSIAQKTDKRRAFIWGSLSWVVVLAALMLVKPQQVAPVYVLAVLAGSGLATAFVIPWSMVPDIIEYDQLKTGQRREGAYYSFASLFQKAATGVAMVVLGQLLAWAGYINPTLGSPLPTQPEAAVTVIRWFIGPVPIVLLLLSIVFAWRYPISRESHRAMREEIARTLLDK